jgi:hypothetical protein
LLHTALISRYPKKSSRFLSRSFLPAHPRPPHQATPSPIADSQTSARPHLIRRSTARYAAHPRLQPHPRLESQVMRAIKTSYSQASQTSKLSLNNRILAQRLLSSPSRLQPSNFLLVRSQTVSPRHMPLPSPSSTTAVLAESASVDPHVLTPGAVFLSGLSSWRVCQVASAASSLGWLRVSHLTLLSRSCVKLPNRLVNRLAYRLGQPNVQPAVSGEPTSGFNGWLAVGWTVPDHGRQDGWQDVALDKNS